MAELTKEMEDQLYELGGYDPSTHKTDPALLQFLNNDHGNAERITHLYGDVLRFCHPFKKWLIWDGRRWVVDSTGQVVRFAKKTMLDFLRETIEVENDKSQRFARSSLNAKNIRSALELAQSEIYVTP